MPRRRRRRRCRCRHSQSVLNCQFKFIGSRSPASWSSSIAAGVSTCVFVAETSQQVYTRTHTYTHTHTHTDNRCLARAYAKTSFWFFGTQTRLELVSSCAACGQTFVWNAFAFRFALLLLLLLHLLLLLPLPLLLLLLLLSVLFMCALALCGH